MKVSFLIILEVNGDDGIVVQYTGFGYIPESTAESQYQKT